MLPSISLIVDAATIQQNRVGPGSIAELTDGTPIAPETLSRFLCDAVIHPIVIGESPRGPSLHHGRRHRTATPAQRRVLRTLYPTCPIDGTTPFDHCEIHHVQPFEHDGTTDLPNLVPISRRWHHLVHEGRYQLTIDTDRTLHLTRPDGHHRTIPPPTPITRQRE